MRWAARWDHPGGMIVVTTCRDLRAAGPEPADGGPAAVGELVLRGGPVPR
jgi:hypothetical protein